MNSRAVLLVVIGVFCLSENIIFSHKFAKAEEEGDGGNVCLLYSGKNYSGGAPLLSVRPTVKVFDTHLLFYANNEDYRSKNKSTNDSSSGSDTIGIRIQSVKLLKANCSVILCDAKHLQGNCTEFTENHNDISVSEKEVYKNVRSVDCHCSFVDPDSIVTLPDVPSPLPPSGKLQKEGYPQPVRPALQRRLSSCSVLYRDWHYKGLSHFLDFPGTTTKTELGRLRSIYVKDGCTVNLWNAGNKDQSVTSSVSFLEADFTWACCYCDSCSQSVCEQAQNKSSAVEFSSSSLETFSEADHSQFVKYGKKIFGIGQNYRWTKVEVAKYLSVPKEPIVFLKPSTSYIREGQLIKLPKSLGTIFYELELGVVIGRRGKDISEKQALDFVAGYFLALDMTAKEFIKRSGNQSLPWEIGKGFDTACPVGDFIPKSMIPDPNNVHLECKLNGQVTQSDSTSRMIFDVQQLIAYISKFVTLEPYDAILTGTPDGFGPLRGGDVIEGKLGNLTSIRFQAEEV